MDRQIVYPGQIPLETDLLNTNKNAMVAIGKLVAAIFGTSTFVNGLSVVATGPASMSVQVNPGEIYALQNIDGTAYSSLAADTTHQIMKQGILLDAITLACPAPATAGQSINYLIQATYQDSDTGLVALPYYNASNPAQAYSGPNNTGTQQATVRKGTVVVSAKAGIAAATGSQITPAPDAGYIGLYVVTVANGQTQITAGNIVPSSGSPQYASLLAQVQAENTGRLIGVQKFTANGTYTPTSGTNSVVVEVQGGGGGGGGAGATGAGQLAAGGGGAGGAYAKGRLTSGFSGIAVTIGGGGSAGTTTLPAGNGGTTSFGALISAPGGGGGTGMSASTANIVAGGNCTAATGGNLVNANGPSGGIGIVTNGSSVLSGAGGGSAMAGGAGGGGMAGGGGSGAAGSAPGAGGSGGTANPSSAGTSGGAGAAGCVIIWEFA